MQRHFAHHCPSNDHNALRPTNVDRFSYFPARCCMLFVFVVFVFVLLLQSKSFSACSKGPVQGRAQRPTTVRTTPTGTKRTLGSSARSALCIQLQLRFPQRPLFSGRPARKNRTRQILMHASNPAWQNCRCNSAIFVLTIDTSTGLYFVTRPPLQPRGCRFLRNSFLVHLLGTGMARLMSTSSEVTVPHMRRALTSAVPVAKIASPTPSWHSPMVTSDQRAQSITSHLKNTGPHASTKTSRHGTRYKREACPWAPAASHMFCSTPPVLTARLPHGYWSLSFPIGMRRHRQSLGDLRFFRFWTRTKHGQEREHTKAMGEPVTKRNNYRNRDCPHDRPTCQRRLALLLAICEIHAVSGIPSKTFDSSNQKLLMDVVQHSFKS